MTEDFITLIPELPKWNNGEGIEPRAWIECVGNFELAAGYSLIFWPRFVRFEDYVLREGFLVESLRGFEDMTRRHRGAVEDVMNHIHIADIHCNVESTEQQLRYLGRVLKDIHAVKLQHDFPDLSFEVCFNDEPGLDLRDYQMSFWQAED